ncbi:DUF2339 domain-containing protein [Glaciecola siphonariae]|uniref:DUF2339 domain-containing protein n=1 Tax=Glaciecola siphonariae TaxID=521012 RepID=A0ABV9LZA9_9ALTE
MEAWVLFGILIVLALFGGSILSFVHIGKISELRRQLEAFKALLLKHQAQIVELEKKVAGTTPETIPPSVSKTADQNDDETSVGEQAQALANSDAVLPQTEPTPVLPSATPASSNEPVNSASAAVTSKTSTSRTSTSKTSTSAPVSDKSVSKGFQLEKFLMGNGLLWLGAIVLALGGVFLAKYSIEAGLFPPQLRIILGASFGLLLVGAAEYLYRFPKRFNINTPVISAALASGGVITCFSMVLVAFDFYAYLSPIVAFALLAIISLSAAWLSLRLGPILAAIGVIGAYAVPALISTGSNNVLILLIYVSAVSFSAIWIHQIVQRAWLWYLGLLGHMAWFVIAIYVSSESALMYELDTQGYQNLGVLTAFALLSVYLFVLLPILGWNLSERFDAALSVKQMLMPRKEHLGILLPIAGLILYALAYYYDSAFYPSYLWTLIVFSALMLAAPIRHSAFDTWPFLALGFTVFMYLLMPQNYDYSDNVFVFTGGYLLAQIAALIGLVYAFLMMRLRPERPAFALLLVVGPLGIMSLSYALSNADAASLLYPLFALELGIIGLVFAYFALKASRDFNKLAYLLLANGALTLTFTMLLSASVLTLAIAIQICLMAVLSRKYLLTLPHWLYKAAMLVVLARLSFAPWLPEYADERLLGIHWSMVIYPLVFAVLWFARRHITEPSTRIWLGGALLHLAALFVTTETSYLLTGGYPDFGALSFEQSVLLSMNWLILASVYLWRAKALDAPEHAKGVSSKLLYSIFAVLLMFGAGLIHIDVSVFNSPFISAQPTGTSPWLNYLIPLWLIPALTLGAGLKWQLFHKDFVKPASIIASAMLFMYINGVVRLVYNAELSLFAASVQQAELYTYSILWLVIAIAVIVLAQYLMRNSLNRLGFSILALVVLKAFLIDMSNLEGLFRALSFIGLGLSLVGIGWLFQRFKRSHDEALPHEDAPQGDSQHKQETI